MLISFEEVEKIWNTNTRPVVLYLHNPFCKGGKCIDNCTYCVNRGYPTNNEELVNKFYFEEMPKRIKKYLPIIKKQDIKLISFGGGTPNFLSVEKLDKYYNILSELIPDFLKLPKIIELHSAYINEELIILLKKYNFTNLIFCFQTFNQKILDSQNRLNCDIDIIKKSRELARKLNIHVGCDIMTCWTDNFRDWNNVLSNDLKIVKKLDMDEITISPLVQVKYSSNNINDYYEYIKFAIDKNLSDYYNPELSKYSKDFFSIRLFKTEEIPENWKMYINSLTDFSWNFEQGISTLGIGNYNNGNKSVYSIIGPNYTICEKNDKDSFNIKYDLIKKYNFWDSIKNVIDALQKEFGDIEVPVGTEIVFRNICEMYNNTYLWDECKQGNCIWHIFDDCLISGNEIEEKIKNKFKEKKEIIDKNKIRNYNL